MISVLAYTVIIVETGLFFQPACIRPLPQWGPALPEDRAGSRYCMVNPSCQVNGEDSINVSKDLKNGISSQNGGYDNPASVTCIDERL